MKRILSGRESGVASLSKKNWLGFFSCLHIDDATQENPLHGNSFGNLLL
jgi:hypothetical protein